MVGRLFVFLFLSLKVFGGTGENPHLRTRYPYFRISAAGGWILPHSPELRPLSQSHPLGIRFDAGYLSIDSASWVRTRSYARVGLSLVHNNFQNSAQLGSATGILPFLEPYVFRKGRLQANFSMGMGLVYLSRVYHPVQNPENVFFSSPLSFQVEAAIRWQVLLTRQIKLVGSGRYAHISNGGIRMPNKGMNFPLVELGMEYLPLGEQFPLPPKTKNYPRKWLFSADFGGALKNTPSNWKDGSEPQPVLNFSIRAEKAFSSLNRIFLAKELTLDGFLEKKLRHYQLSGIPLLPGVLVGHTCVLGKLELRTGMGLYAYHPDPAASLFYQRYSLHYTFHRKWQIGGSLKTHGHVADIFDFRITRLFHR